MTARQEIASLLCIIINRFTQHTTRLNVRHKKADALVTYVDWLGALLEASAGDPPSAIGDQQTALSRWLHITRYEEAEVAELCLVADAQT